MKPTDDLNAFRGLTNGLLCAVTLNTSIWLLLRWIWRAW